MSIHSYQNTILEDCLTVMTTDDLLEFAIECQWLQSFLGEATWLLVKKRMFMDIDKPWRTSMRDAVKEIVPNIEETCLPQPN